MFNKKKKGNENPHRIQQKLTAALSPCFKRLGDRLKLRQRLRLANVWAIRHPRKLMFNYSSFAVLLLGMTLLSDLFCTDKQQQDPISLKSIPSMSHRLQSLNDTEIKKERIKQEVHRLGEKGLEVYNELDSLMKLPDKTRKDSLRIIANYDILNKTFNNNRNEP